MIDTLATSTSLGETVTLDQFLEDLRQQKVVYLSEWHFEKDHIANASTLMDCLQDTHEFAFEHVSDQETLNAFYRGNIPENEFAEKYSLNGYMELIKQAKKCPAVHAIGTEFRDKIYRSQDIAMKLMEKMFSQKIQRPIVAVMGQTHVFEHPTVPKFVEIGVGVKGSSVMQYFDSKSYALTKEEQELREIYSQVQKSGNSRLIIKPNKEKINYFVFGRI